MRIDFNISQTERGKFRTACEAAIRNVGEGTKAATTDACIGIMSESFAQVPIDTGTLYESAFFGVSRRTDVKNYRYGAVMGYGDTGGIGTSVGLGPIDWIKEPNNGINPKNGFQASTYAAKVHEDLDMPHPNGGKAKFLEDPIRNWAAGKFARTAMAYWKVAITTSSTSGFHSFWHRGVGRNHAPGYYPWMKGRINKYNFEQHRNDVQRGGEYVRRGESE